MRISIEGLIGSGKTTVCKVLRPHYIIYEEDVNSWLPWIEKCQENPQRWALTLQLKILMDMTALPENCICERSPFTARGVFVQKLRDRKIINEEEHILYLEFHNKLGWKPDYIIYIDTDPVNCFNRIQKRGRICEKSLTLKDLLDLQRYHNCLFRQASVPVQIVDGNQDPQTVAEQVKKILDDITNC